ncbi:CubicO group peptidase (beta-lactamase class C family), partial [Paenibacillus brasilensis]|nr:CubicO group peptidase (beta-lactamase class C family) [Paenibacillus brasilensis]
LTLIAILAGTLAYGTVHAEGQTATYQAIDKAATTDNILSSELAKEPKKELNEKEKKRKHREEVKRVMAGGLQDGERWSYATGTASFGVPRPVEPDFSFRIGSITKTLRWQTDS